MSHVTPYALQEQFLELLPRLQEHARISFRHVRCPDRRADLVAETVAIGWKWFRRLHEQGKNAMEFPAVFAGFAARAVKCGRKIAGKVRAKDAMNEHTQARHDFCVSKLPDQSTLEGNPLSEALIDNTQSPPSEQAAFRCDFSDWLHSLTARDQRMATDMGLGHRTCDLADQYGVSPGRISQKRDQFKRDWHLFIEAA